MSDKTIATISNEDVYYFRERNRNRVYASVVAVFSTLVKRDGLTKKEIASRLGKDPAQITRWLSGPANWTLDTVSDLLLAMGAEMDHPTAFMNERLPNSTVHPLMVGRRPASVTHIRCTNDATGNSDRTGTNDNLSYAVGLYGPN